MRGSKMSVIYRRVLPCLIPLTSTPHMFCLKEVTFGYTRLHRERLSG
uniref:Uncharacterized protein n=1 Tax=Siphoviridae sp. ctSXZ3 TaxID=2825510 RepID=A0A8S5VEQ7_9CAUD|nr:MAG TPA: Protein of unknown function (DUF2517) [Siphoviridae sp. ctSXZ3]